MIYEALTFVATELNQYLKSRFNIDEDKVIVANIVEQNGDPVIKDDNKVIMSVINIQQERLLLNNPHYVDTNPPVCLNLYVLFSTTFRGNLSGEALKYMSVIIGFFQAQHVFDESSGLDANIEKLIFEFFNTDFQSTFNLWSSIGAKYTPSVIYKVRMIIIDEGLLNTEFTQVEAMGEEQNAEEEMTEPTE